MSLPKPVHWRETPSITAVGALVFAGAVGIVALVWAMAAARRADYLTAIAMLGLAMFMLCLLSSVTIGRLGRVNPRAAFDSEGTVLRVDAVISRLFIAGLCFLVLSTALFAVFGSSGGIDIPMVSRQRFAVPIAMAIVGVIALVGVIRAVALGGLGSIRLTPHGFEVATMFSTDSGRWSDVDELTDLTADKHAYLPIVMVMKDGSSQVITATNSYTSNGRGLYWMVRHYWLHPEHRAELVDGRAVERLSREQFDVDS